MYKSFYDFCFYANLSPSFTDLKDSDFRDLFSRLYLDLWCLLDRYNVPTDLDLPSEDLFSLIQLFNSINAYINFKLFKNGKISSPEEAFED